MTTERSRPGSGTGAAQSIAADISSVLETVNDPALGYADAADVYWQRGWRSVLPLPRGQKFPPPTGYTGGSAAVPSYADVQAWCESHPGGNLSIRLPDGVVGIDVDAYDDKRGAETLKKGETRWGALPHGPRSTSRLGDTVSGIRLHRVPPGSRLVDRVTLDGVSDIEIIQPHHRFVTCWPSTHPDSGAVYMWVDKGNHPCEVPHIDDLPKLPSAWLAGLQKVEWERVATQPVSSTSSDAGPYCKKALEAEMIAMASTAQGGRNDQLNRSSFSLGQLVPHGLSEAEVIDGLTMAANSTAGTPMTESEISKTIRSGISAGMREPRYPPERYGTDVDISVVETAASTSATTAPITGSEAEVRSRMSTLAIDREARRRLDEQDRPPITAPAVTPLRDLLAAPDVAAQYVIDKVAPAGGRVLLSAQYKAGKSTVVGNVVRSHADRTPFLGRFEVSSPAHSVVLIDTELSEGTLRRWLRDQNIVNTGAVADVVALRGRVGAFDLIDQKRRAEWARRLRGLRCDYLILDCLRPVLDALGLDEHRDAGRFLVAFDALLSEAGVSDALVVHHMGHTNERSRGDSRLQDWPDALWRLVRENDEPGSARFFSAYGRDVDLPEGRIAFDPKARHLTYVDGSRKDSKADAARPDVLGALAQCSTSRSDGSSGRQIEDALRDAGHGRAAIREALRSLIAQGIVTTADGPRRSTLHRITTPCLDCGFPLTVGQETRHIGCHSTVTGVA